MNSQKFETRENKSVVLFYIENLSDSQVCIDIIGLKKNEVKNLKKASVKVYDFYFKSKKVLF